jgi:hypothetical protein
MLQPPWLSAHFVARPIFVSPSLPPKPARSARPFGPVRPTRVSSPTSGSHPHHRLSDCATAPCATVCCSPLHTSSRTEPAPHLLHFPHQDGVAPSPLPPLTPSKPMRSKTPLPPATSPPPHRLPGPIKRTPPPPFRTTLAAPLLRTSPHPQSLDTEHHRRRLLLSTTGLIPPLPWSPKHMVRTSKIPSTFFCSRSELRALASLMSPHSDEAPVAFCPWVHRGPKRCPVYGLCSQSTGFSC